MERDCQMNVEVDSKKASEIHSSENMGSCEKGNFVQYIPYGRANILVPPEGNMNPMDYFRVRMDGQLDPDTYIDEERFDSALTISEHKKFMKQTESSRRKSKFLNQTDSSGQQLISNGVSNFQSKPEVRASRRANAKHQQETSTKKTQHQKSSTIQQVQAKECTSQPTKNPKPSTEIKKAQRSTSSTNNLSTSASRATPNQGNPLSEISSPAITKSKAPKNSVGQQGKTKQVPEPSAKNPSTPVQRSRVQANSSHELSSMDNKRTHYKKDSSTQKVWRVKSKQQPSNSESRNLIPPSSPKRSTKNSESRNLMPPSSPKRSTSNSESRNLIAPSSSKRSRNLTPTSPIYYISCDGSVKTHESFAEKCVICESDLHSPFKNWEVHEYYDEYEDEIQPAFPLPDVAVLACGHVFHSECLDCFVPEDQSNDPPCILCLSNNS